MLSGLQTIPSEVYEAARVDGASPWYAYRTITLPLLKPAILVAATINVINVFNSFPIIWEMTRGGPGYETSTTTTFMFILKQAFIGESAAMSVVNFLLVIVVVLLFLRMTRWRGGGRLMGAISTAPAPPRRVGAGAAGTPAARRSRAGPSSISVLAYGVALIFLLPYLEMIVAALRPQISCWRPTCCRRTSAFPTSQRSGRPASAAT